MLRPPVPRFHIFPRGSRNLNGRDFHRVRQRHSLGAIWAVFDTLPASSIVAKMDASLTLYIVFSRCHCSFVILPPRVMQNGV